MQTFKLLLRMELDANPSDILLSAKDDNGMFKTALPTEEKAYTAPDYGHIFDDAFKVAVNEENRGIFADAPERYFRFDGPNLPSGAWRLQNGEGGWTLENRFEEMAEKCVEDGPQGQFMKLKKDDIMEIYKLALE